MSKILTKTTNQIFKALYFCGKNAPLIAGSIYATSVFLCLKKFVDLTEDSSMIKKIDKKIEELTSTLEEKMKQHKIAGLNRKHRSFSGWHDSNFMSKNLYYIKREINSKEASHLSDEAKQEILELIKNLEYFKGQIIYKFLINHKYKNLDESDSLIKETMKILKSDNNSRFSKIKTWLFGWPKDKFINAYLSCRVDDLVAEQKASATGIKLDLSEPVVEKKQRSLEEIKQKLEGIESSLSTSPSKVLSGDSEIRMYNALLSAQYMSDADNKNKIKNSVFPKIAKVIFAAVSVFGGILCGILVDIFLQGPKGLSISVAKENCFPRVGASSFAVGQNLPRVSKSYDFGL